MTLVINTNITSSVAQSNLSKVGDSLQTTIQRLSSGLRVNTAADDASGFAIANRMEAQVIGMAVATRNANDAISFSQTASGALSQISNNLQRMRELAVQAANGSNSSSDTSLLNQEFSQLQNEVSRIQANTTFNNLNVFNALDTVFQIGSNNGSNDRINMQGTALTSLMSLGTQTIADRTTITASGDITSAIASATASTNATLTSVYNFAIDAINASQKLSFANKNDLLNNLSIGYSAAVAAGTPVATYSTTIQANMSSVTEQAAFGSTTGVISTTLLSVASDITSVVTAVLNAGNAQGASVTSVYNAAVNAVNDPGITSTNSSKSAVLSTFSNALSASIKNGIEQMNASAFSLKLFFNLTSLTTMQYGGGAVNSSSTVIGNSLIAGSLLYVNSATLGQSNAQSAITAIDSALTEVNKASAVQGALQNRFAAVISNLSAFSQSQTAAKSRIVDADFAAETAKLSKNQILQQAGTAMLAQANQISSTVLSLLK
jgi:flagellin